MKIKELIERLSRLDPERLVVVWDPRSGEALPLFDVECKSYADGEVGLEALEPGYDEEDLLDGQPCVALYGERNPG
jgi:hypothetical protein